MPDSTGKLSRASRITISLFTGLCLAIGMSIASFIFICGMKYMDGPQGSSLEAPLVLMLPLMSLYYPGLLTWSLSRDGIDFNPIVYLFSCMAVAVLFLAAFTGWSIKTVLWGSSTIELLQLSELCALSGAIAVIALLLHLGLFGLKAP
ncbi:MAG: hypothetical protein AB7W16_00520 [Candidatus Obscuribacterales bacterium]